MRWWIAGASVIIAAALVFVWRGGTSTGSRQELAQAVEVATERSGAGAGPAAPAPREADPDDDALSQDADREIFEATIRRALRARVDTLPIGERVVALGRWFVGAPYTPGTLEVRPERLVVNLREFDCVTYVETMLAMARLLDGGQPTFELS